MAAICEHFGWTYWEYMEQPSWFLTLIQEKMQMDAQEREREQKKAEQQASRRK